MLIQVLKDLDSSDPLLKILVIVPQTIKDYIDSNLYYKLKHVEYPNPNSDDDEIYLAVL